MEIILDANLPTNEFPGNRRELFRYAKEEILFEPDEINRFGFCANSEAIILLLSDGIPY